MAANFDDSALKEIIIGRVEPYIYSFRTNTLPDLLKVGDTYRPVEERLNEWRRYYQDLTEVSRHKAVVNDDIFFRDHAVHRYLENSGVKKVPIDPINNIHSREFFEGIGEPNVTTAINDVISSYGESGRYKYYNNFRERVEYHYERKADFSPRDNQQIAINNFSNAINSGRTNLLMYAVMRFGKSITTMWCAKTINARLTVVVSGKADVRSEWKQTVESHIDFAGYRFMDSSDLKKDLQLSDIYGAKFQTASGETETCTNIVLFLTLQDLAGSSGTIKEHHRILKDASPDLLVIDETHFGARAQVLGKILAGVELIEEDEVALKITDSIDELGRIDKLESINAKFNIHLSGTPYRILMGSEFEEQDIIAFVQFSDIYEEKLKWGAEHLDENEWDNPYYGFPQMIRFAFNPNESSRKKLEQIPGSKPSELFEPISTKTTGDYETFIHEQEVIDLLQVLDGSKQDTQLLGLLDHESVKAGKLANHMVIVLPFKASCDAFEKLVNSRKELFKNLPDYKLLNISGFNAHLTDIDGIKSAIKNAHVEGTKTITLTVNKMLTGTTVPEWDTMIYLKNTTSPQEYDQAIFRLQSPWIEKYVDETKDGVIKYDMKPQTLLVDLDPTRLFYLQEIKAFTYGANTNEIGNEKIEQFISRELRVSPIIALNAEGDKLVEIDAAKIIDAVRKYSNERSITDDVNDISVDLSLKDNPEIYDVISKLSELGSRGGLSIMPTEDEGEELEGEPKDPPKVDTPNGTNGSPEPSGSDDNETKSFEKQLRMYYVLILLFAFLSDTKEKTLNDVIENIDANDDNRRISRSLGLKKEHLTMFRDNVNWSVRNSLEYKIQNSDFRANDGTISPVEHIEIAINKFGKLSDSEIFTPMPVVDKIYDEFDDNFWSSARTSKILDIASKSGNFARGYVDRAIAREIAMEDIKDNFYSIPTSPTAYEFTRKMYSALGLNVDNIARNFTSDNLVEANPTWVPSNIRFSDITKSDLYKYDRIAEESFEGDKVKFTAIVGNPPYQENITGRGDQPPIYHKFLESAYSLSDKVAVIHPARFLFNAGLTPKSWNQKMLHDTHVKVVYFEQNSAKVFPNTDIKGGVAITFRDTDHDFGEIGVFTSSPELSSILHKVAEKNELTLDKLITGRGIYRLTNAALSEHPEVEELQSKGHKTDVGTGVFGILKGILFFENKPNDGEEYVKVIGLNSARRAYYWINQRYLSEPENFKKYKVILPNANGSGAIGEILSTPLIGEPLTGYSETFIGIGSFDSKDEAEAALKYVKSKFARTMLGILKITQHNSRDKWAKVPQQNFTSKSDIDWSKSIQDIDRQLYVKYGLDESEITFIEERVKAME
jgi:superfamily II DNA or RNA helicase